MTMNIMPAAVLTGVSVVVNIGAAIANATSGGSMAVLAVSVLQTLMSLYLTLFVLGAITTVTEWKNIRCAAWKKGALRLHVPALHAHLRADLHCVALYEGRVEADLPHQSDDA